MRSCAITPATQPLPDHPTQPNTNTTTDTVTHLGRVDAERDEALGVEHRQLHDLAHPLELLLRAPNVRVGHVRLLLDRHHCDRGVDARGERDLDLRWCWVLRWAGWVVIGPVEWVGWERESEERGGGRRDPQPINRRLAVNSKPNLNHHQTTNHRPGTSGGRRPRASPPRRPSARPCRPVRRRT